MNKVVRDKRTVSEVIQKMIKAMSVIDLFYDDQYTFPIQIMMLSKLTDNSISISIVYDTEIVSLMIVPELSKVRSLNIDKFDFGGHADTVFDHLLVGNLAANFTRKGDELQILLVPSFKGGSAKPIPIGGFTESNYIPKAF